MWYLTFKWLQRDSSPQPLSSSTKTQVFGQTDQMIVLLVLICTAHMPLCSYLVTYVSQSKPTLYICLNVRQFLPRRRHDIWSLSECNVTRTQNYIVHKPHSTTWPNWPNVWADLWVLICTVQLTVCSYHVTYASHIEFTLYICLDATELLAWSKRDIWNLTVFIGTRIQKDLVHKRTLNYLAKLTK